MNTINNECSFIGRASTDYNLNYYGTQSGDEFAVLQFSLAVDMGKDRNGNRKTYWVHVKVTGPNAEYLRKYGKPKGRIYVRGFMENVSYTGRDGQEKRYDVLNAEKVGIIDFIEKGDNDENVQASQQGRPAAWNAGRNGNSAGCKDQGQGMGIPDFPGVDMCEEDNDLPFN